MIVNATHTIPVDMRKCEFHPSSLRMLLAMERMRFGPMFADWSSLEHFRMRAWQNYTTQGDEHFAPNWRAKPLLGPFRPASGNEKCLMDFNGRNIDELALLSQPAPHPAHIENLTLFHEH
ncbi:hypothetical protein PS655_01415 [Pseudomonas fluorescens]|uniref:Uncharacterized protein n=1 Tax=Pseudomonas fluorescens TaxID=294 RepID=A0A5E6R6G4_PSEFL|nr:hypothetical protein PS655_01415 [Pseudomonas fluorescens]